MAGGETCREWTAEDLPSVMTEPCFRHFEADAQVGWTIASADQLSIYVAHLFMWWAEKYIRARPKSDANFEASVAWREESRKAYEVATRTEQLYLQIEVTRGVGSFLSYLSEILSHIFLLNPALLPAGDHKKYDEARGQPDEKERLREIVETRMTSLSFKGLADIEKFVKTRLDFELFTDSIKSGEVGRAIAERNLIIHSRAVADAKFLQRMGGHTTLKHGEPLILDRQTVSQQAKMLRVAVADIDARASAKFGLPRPITEEQFYERVKVPFFVGDWRSLWDEDDLLLADDTDDSAESPS
jgi:hypothetical protein